MTAPSFAALAEQEAQARADVVDDGDRAQYLAEQQRQNALAARYEPPADPQARLPDGTVVCWDCETPIPKARLAANPHAVRCIDCQRRVERADELTRRVFGG
jgi:DnaK suppressor protein